MRDCRKCDRNGRCRARISGYDDDEEFSKCPYDKDQRYRCWNYEGLNGK